MADAIRGLAGLAVGIAAGFLGPGGFNAVQFAIGQFLFNLIVPPKVAVPDEPVGSAQGAKSTAVDTVIPRIFGVRAIEGGFVLRCATDQVTGERSGIRWKRVKKTVGSTGFGPFKKSVKQSKVNYFLYATIGVCEGYRIINRIERNDPGDGDKDQGGKTIIWNRDGQVGDKILQRQLEDLQTQYDAATEAQRIAIQKQIDKLKAANTKLLVLTPLVSSVTGTLLADYSEKVALYYGSEEQPFDAVEQGWYAEEGGCSADRGIVKVRFNGYKIQLGTTFTYHIYNEITNRREIITYQLLAAGVPQSRIWLRSITETEGEEGWFMDGAEPARALAEQVAAVAFHDLHFMPIRDDADGTLACLGFTDISRVTPRYIELDDDEMGAVVNNGDVQFATSSQNRRETGEAKPRLLSIGFFNILDNQKTSSAQASYPLASGEPQEIGLRYVGELQDVQDFADVAMLEIQGAGGTTSVVLMPSRCEVAPGCVLTWQEYGKRSPLGRTVLRRVIAQSPTPEGLMPSTCAPYDPAIYKRQTPVARVVAPPSQTLIPTLPEILVVDGPALNKDMVDTPTIFLVMALSPGFSMESATITSLDGAFEDFDADDGATTGTLSNEYVFDEGDLADFDAGVELSIIVDYGVFGSALEAVVNSRGANLIYLLHPDGDGVYANYLTAVKGETGTVTLSGIRPGAFGRDTVRSFPVGTRVILMTDTQGAEADGVYGVSFDLTRRGDVTEVVAYDQDDEDGIEGEVPVEIELIGRCLNALAPDEVVAVEQEIVEGAGTDNYILSFTALSRDPSESASTWIPGSIFGADPLSFEVRLLDAFDDEVNTRLVVGDLVTGPNLKVIYTAAQLTSYYGAMPTEIYGEVQQNGTYGLGYVREFTAPVVLAPPPGP